MSHGYVEEFFINDRWTDLRGATPEECKIIWDNIDANIAAFEKKYAGWDSMAIEADQWLENPHSIYRMCATIQECVEKHGDRAVILFETFFNKGHYGETDFDSDSIT